MTGAQTIRASGPGLFVPAGPAEGDRVAAGSTVAFLRAGELLRPILAPADGRLGPCLATEGALLGWGDPVQAFVPDGDCR